MIEACRNPIFYGTIICIMGIIVFGCKDKEWQQPGKIKHSKSSVPIVAGNKEVLAVVRSVTIGRLNALTDDEKMIIRESDPQIAQYQMGGTFGQYFWTWKLQAKHTISVSFTGDLESMDPNEIKVSLFEINH